MPDDLNRVSRALSLKLIDAPDETAARAAVAELDLLSTEDRLTVITAAAVRLGRFARWTTDACNDPTHVARIPEVAERELFDSIVRHA